MPKRGSTRAVGRDHEDYVAVLYSGKVSPSSGGHVTDPGDVRVEDDNTLFECKSRGNPEKFAKSTMITQMEKVTQEAYEENKEPALALRFFNPDSHLSGKDGFVELTVRLSRDDAYRSERLRYVDKT